MAKLTQKVIKHKLPQLTPAIRSAVVKVVNETVQEVFDISQQLVPVDKGDLKASGAIETYNEGEAQRVVYGTDHCLPVEFGTHNSAAQPFLRPAAESVKTRLNRRLGQIEKGLGKEINGIGNRNR